MQYGNLCGIDKPIARLVQGTVMIGSNRLDESFALLDAIYELGGSAFDTAHVYGNGDTERTLGRWVNDRGLRDEVVIITKGAHHNADRNCVTPYDITAHLHDSLARLKTDYIDLYLLHRDDPAVPVGPIVERLNQHLEEGLIHAFGGSNWSHARIKAANDYAEAHGLTPFAVSSPQFSLAEMVEEPWPNCVSIGGPKGAAAREYYRESQIALFTWSSLAGGFFSGRFTPGNLDTFTSEPDLTCVNSYCYPENFERLARAGALAAAKGLALPQIALAYVLSQPLHIFALVGCHTPDEFKENIAALAVSLTPEEAAWLELKREEMPQ
ncbi:MAG: aldo/keto reductase [Anaerolineae bacterium]|nr:aldo/keto reductase [Anaerolineae bacterium]